MSATQSPIKLAQGLLNKVNEGKEVHDAFAKNFQANYRISGKTMKEWENHFKLSIPEDPDPGTCKALDMKIMGLYQEASFYYNASAAYVQAIKKGTESEYRSKYAALVAEYKASGKKLPARGTLEDLVRSETDTIDSALANAELQKDFWKNIMNDLNMYRRLLENATINSGIQIKMDNNHKGTIYDHGRT